MRVAQRPLRLSPGSGHERMILELFTYKVPWFPIT